MNGPFTYYFRVCRAIYRRFLEWIFISAGRIFSLFLDTNASFVNPLDLVPENCLPGKNIRVVQQHGTSLM
jgi:hypothetical protein